MQSNNQIFILAVLSMLMCSVVLAQPSEPRMSKPEYIAKFKDHAIREMHVSGVPASITLAQGMLESDYGNSPLAKYANNHFGIKCHKGWDGPTFIQDDDEANECFRKYYSAYESYRDHSQFLRTRDRYASLFELKTTDFKGWAKGLKKAGYATNPKYADMLIKIIEVNNLSQYDLVVKLPEPEIAERVEQIESVPVEVLSARRVEVSENNIKYVLAENGDTPTSIAEANGMGAWQVLKYNDLKKNDVVYPGDIVYLQPKRNNAMQDFHTVAAGETLRDISQRYGVKVKRILKMNGLPESYSPQSGDRLKLRKISGVEAALTGR